MPVNYVSPELSSVSVYSERLKHSCVNVIVLLVPSTIKGLCRAPTLINYALCMQIEGYCRLGIVARAGRFYGTHTLAETLVSLQTLRVLGNYLMEGNHRALRDSVTSGARCSCHLTNGVSRVLRYSITSGVHHYCHLADGL